MKRVGELIRIPNTQIHTSKQHAKVFDLLFSSIVTILGLNCSRLLSPGQCWEEILFERKHSLECSLTKKRKKGCSKLL